MFYVPQIRNDDCGLACLKMLLVKFHKDSNYQFLKVDERKGGYSYHDLVKIAAENSMSLDGIKVANKLEIAKANNLPIIVTLVDKDKRNHSVIVEKVMFSRVKIIDPFLGPYWMPLKKFINLWDSTALIVNEYEPCKSEAKDECKVISNKHLLLTSLLHFFSGVCFIAGLYFLAPNDNIALSIGLFMSGFIVEILLKYYLIKLMKKFDNSITKKKYLTSNRYDFFTRSEKYKTISFTTNFDLTYYLLISSFIIVVLIMNNIYEIVLFGVCMILVFLETVLFTPTLRRKEMALTMDEERLKNIKDENNFNEEVQRIRDEAYKYAKWSSFKEACYVFVLILTSFLLAFLTEFNLVNIVFNVCISIFLKNNLVNLFTYYDKTIEKRYYSIRLNNLLTPSDNS